MTAFTPGAKLADAAPPRGMAVPHRRTALVFPGLAGFYALAQPLSYAALRIAFGLILLTHGLPKVLGGGHGSLGNPLASATSFIDTKLHLPAPTLFGYFAAFLESGGALMLALGLLTRIVAPMIAVEMACICMIHYPAFTWIDRGMEYALLMGFVALHISFRGGGRFSLDRLIGKEI